MGIDTSKAGQVIAAQMEAIEKDFADKEGYEIGAVVTIVGIQGPDGSNLRIRNNLGDPVMTLGILRLAEDELIRALRGGGR
jgi:hypothetical protein